MPLLETFHQECPDSLNKVFLVLKAKNAAATGIDAAAAGEGRVATGAAGAKPPPGSTGKSKLLPGSSAKKQTGA